MARLFSVRKLALGVFAAAAALAVKNRQKVAGLLGGGTSAPAPYTPTYAPAPPPVPANADVAGPPENTSTSVPAPDPVVQDPGGGIDEVAEEAAAAAEAGNIGGPAPDYPDTADETAAASAADRPLEEAGEGSSEGLELAEADLVDNAEAAAGDPIEGERQVEEVIEAQDDPSSGEALPETVVSELPPPPTEPPTAFDPPPPPPPPADDKSTAVWKNEEQATVEAPAITPEDGKN